MHIFVIFVLILTALCLMRGRIDVLSVTGAAFLLLLSVLLVVFFLLCLIKLLFMKRKEAHFTRIDFKSEDSRYEVAFYRVGDKEYPCIFPEEGVFRSFFYNPARKCHVYVNERKGNLFDPVSLITIVAGFFAGIAFTALIYLLFFI